MSDSCEIVVKGHLDLGWSEWLAGLAIRHDEQGDTLLAGQLRDQTAFYGLLAKVRDMGLCLVTVTYRTGRDTNAPCE